MRHQIILAVIETGAYLSSSYHTTVHMDENLGGQLRINFNITMHDLSCDYATVDLVGPVREGRVNERERGGEVLLRAAPSFHELCLVDTSCASCLLAHRGTVGLDRHEPTKRDDQR